MSIVSDFKSFFSDDSAVADYILFEYPQDPSSADIGAEINIFGVLEQAVDQQNMIAVKPLEQANFTVDSKQIKPYTVTIKGVILPTNDTLITNQLDLSNFIEKEYNKLLNYLNGITLFTLYNLYSFILLEPLNLVAIHQVTNTNLTLPEFNFVFQQIQTTTAVSYATANTEKPIEPQNEARVSTQG